MYTLATKYTRVEASQTAASIQNGDTIKVNCINAAATSSGAGTVTIYEADGTTVIDTIELLASSTAAMDCAFRADKGIAITTTAFVSCTIYHSQSG